MRAPPGTGRPHPRGYGTFPKVAGRLVRENKLMDLSTAVHKMTMAPARRFGLVGRGTIAEGMVADMVVFDKEAIIDLATYDNPRRQPIGIKYVFVDGRLTLDHGKVVSTVGGKFI